MFKTLKLGSFRGGRNGIVVAAAYEVETRLPQGLGALDKAARGALTKALGRPGFRGEAGEIALADANHLVVGLGKRDELKPDTLRMVGARVVKALDRLAPGSAKLEIAAALAGGEIDPAHAGRCVAEGMGLANWRVDFFAGAATKVKPPHPPLAIDASDKTFRAGMERGLTLAECANHSRRLSATPPNICSPEWLASEARKLARAHNLQFRVIDFTQARRMKMGGIVAVGQGSANKPCIIVLEHKPARAIKNSRIVLVGKTVTYDTGGYSLKINNMMKGMKYDKDGGCAVLGAMQAIAALKLPVHVVALLPAAENMVSDRSFRPDDIITMYNGVSVEVTNTDAEGRLVLGDALAYACSELRPTAIIDIATLTGGIVIGLGHFCSGVFCNDGPLLERIQRAADSSGEKVWRMPLWPEHREFMRSCHADILNSNPLRSAHPIQGAAFLSYFVDEKIPWAHIDIAGVHAVDSEKDLFCIGPTGYGVRLVADLVAQMAG